MDALEMKGKRKHLTNRTEVEKAEPERTSLECAIFLYPLRNKHTERHTGYRLSES